MKIILAITFFLAAFNGFAKTIVVGKTKAITALRKGVDAATDGDTVLLYPGIYREGNIVIRKSIVLLGIDEPVLDGEDKYEILTLTGSLIKISGIRFVNAGYSSLKDYAALSVVDASTVVIENNTIDNSYFAIHVANAQYAVIANNKITGKAVSEQSAGNGIHLWKCDNMLVEGNSVEGHRDGIYFEFVTNSIIQNNFSTANIRYGLHFMFSNDNAYLRNRFINNGAGVAVMFSRHVLMMENLFEQNWGPSAYGLLLKEISDSRIYQNSFRQNTIGIMMEGINRMDLCKNGFVQNGWALKIQASCSDNSFRCNNVQGNTFDVATNGTMQLNHFYRNYWDGYQGYDLNRDGLGDVPYRPVSMYAMVIEENPNAVLLLHSFMALLLDKAEKALPGITPEGLKDDAPHIKPIPL